MKDLLFFGLGNAKLSKSIATFSLPAGHSCPCARECLAKANRTTGKLTDGPAQQFRCFSASAEIYPDVRASRWNNWELLRGAKSVKAMADLISRSIPAGVSAVRIHVSGDFYSESYFLAWLEVARSRPDLLFYAYTKMLSFWVKHRASIPGNLSLTASKGGKQDSLIEKHGLKHAEVEVVFTTREAKAKGMKIDHDDSLAMKGKKSFALLLHGTQAGSSLAAAAWKVIKSTIGGYAPGRNRALGAKSVSVMNRGVA